MTGMPDLRVGKLLFLMEEEDFTVHSSSTAAKSFRAVLATATRPFVVTGHYTLNPAICDLINEKKLLLGVKFDPDDVEGCVERLVKAKAALGDSDNLVLFVNSTQHQKPRTQHQKSFGSRRFWCWAAREAFAAGGTVAPALPEATSVFLGNVDYSGRRTFYEQPETLNFQDRLDNQLSKMGNLGYLFFLLLRKGEITEFLCSFFTRRLGLSI